ncbi:MAG: 6,7-dimethyl-8-ribityllumazine synthase [Blastochloris sp.]|nr:6,7-dimethyl-8-ribityllumazine synthase [Blastochloris sp.]
MKTLTRRTKSPEHTLGIVASTFNQEYVDGMLKACLENLPGVAPGSFAFQVPLKSLSPVQTLLKKKEIHAVIAFGVIWQGKTAHADLIGSTATQALMQLMLLFEKPVIHQILMVQNERQARERCFGKKLNRGREAAEAALQILKSDIESYG